MSVDVDDLADDAITRSIDAATAHVEAATGALPEPCPVCQNLPCDAVTRLPDALAYGYAEADR